MKKRFKLMSLILSGLLALTACGGSDSKSDEKSIEKNAESYTVGISQFAQHGSLDNCRTGFIEGLAESGIVENENLTIKYKNADADTANANTIAQNFVGEKVDMIVAIATPSAMSAFNATLETEIPMIYSAVTDPVAAQLATEDGKSTGNATGTSDTLPVEAQLKTIREILPDARKLGILYTTSEANSVSTIKIYEELAGQYGFTLITESVTQSSDIPLATDSILGKVDVLTNLTDNTVVNALPLILDKANAKQIPVFGSEIEQVKLGCLAAEGIDYIELGKQTGKMAAQVLKGEAKASELPYAILETPYLYINQKTAEDLGITLNADTIERAKEVFFEISTGA